MRFCDGDDELLYLLATRLMSIPVIQLYVAIKGF